MSYYADNSERARFITGLRELTEFLKNNENVPAPKHTDVLVFPHEISDDARRGEVDRIAVLISVIPERTSGGHYVASLMFGPVEYRAVAIPDSAKEPPR